MSDEVDHLHEQMDAGGERARDLALKVEGLAEHAREVLHRHPSELEHAGVGSRLADSVSDLVGSWRFIAGYVLLTAGWCFIGSRFGFDRYPFQAYTMAVSVLAILMTALVLLAENRSARIDRARAINEYEQVKEIRAMQDDQMRLLVLQREQMRLLEALQSLLP